MTQVKLIQKKQGVENVTKFFKRLNILLQFRIIKKMIQVYTFGFGLVFISMETINDFVNADDKGRQIFKEYRNNQPWCKFIKESKDKYAHWDVAYTNRNTSVIGEIKVRNYDCGDYESWFLQG